MLRYFPIPDDVRERFLLAAAEDALDRLRPERLPELADQLIDLGHCSSAVLELWDAREPICWSDLRPSWHCVLDEVGLARQSPVHAAWIVCESLIRRIAEREVLPWDGGSALVMIHLDLPNLDEYYVGDGYGLSGLIGIFWQWEDAYQASWGRCLPVNRGDPTDFAEQLVEEAARWLSEYGGHVARCRALARGTKPDP